MRNLASTLLSWLEDGRSFALGSVVHALGSAPRGVGSAMAVRDDGLIAGSVSGGCVEGAVVEASLRALRTNRPELLIFGAVSDAVLWEVGLSCGGHIEVWVEPVDAAPIWQSFFKALAGRDPVVRAVRLSADRPASAILCAQSSAGDSRLGSQVSEATHEALQSGESRALEIEGERVFLASYPTPERLIVIGAVHIAIHLVQFADLLGFETIVIEPREAFARVERFFTAPGGLIASWPDKAMEQLRVDNHTYVVTLSHDPKLDDPAIFAAIRGGAAYVGALGSRKTQAKKREDLSQMGLTDEELDRIVGPVGLDIGSQTPEEIALSIIAQIVKAKRTGFAQ